MSPSRLKWIKDHLNLEEHRKFFKSDFQLGRARLEEGKIPKIFYYYQFFFVKRLLKKDKKKAMNSKENTKNLTFLILF